MDYVYAKNSDTGEVGYKLVARTYELDVTEIVHVYVDDVCIDAAPNHPLWVDGYGFIPADELHVGDVVKTASGEKKQITNVETECYDEPVTVYNFEVMDWHTYYVSELEVLVHNSNPCAADSGTNPNTYVKIEGRGSTGRTTPNDLFEEMAMDSTKRNPFDPGEGNTVRKIIESLNDSRWKGWEKWEVVYRAESGRTVTIHFSYDPKNNLYDDFKFKN